MSDATPSWVTPPGATQHRERAPRAAVPATLKAAVVLTTVLASAQIAHVVGRDELVVGLRGFLVLVVALQVVLAVAAARRSAGGALGLLVCQITTAVASLTGGFGEQRLLLALGAVVVVVLVASSLGTFPAIPLPPIQQDD